MELIDFQKNISLANYSLYKVGGVAEYLIIVENEIDLNAAVETARNNALDYIVLENQGRFIANDAGIKGLVIIKSYNPPKQDDNLFKDVVCDKLMIDALKKRGVNLPLEIDVSQVLKANVLIKECGLTGKCIGGVCLNENNFKVEVKNNTGRAEELVQLVSYIKQQVRDNFSIQLEDNFVYVGF